MIVYLEALVGECTWSELRGMSSPRSRIERATSPLAEPLSIRETLGVTPWTGHRFHSATLRHNLLYVRSSRTGVSDSKHSIHDISPGKLLNLATGTFSPSWQHGVTLWRRYRYSSETIRNSSQSYWASECKMRIPKSNGPIKGRNGSPKTLVMNLVVSLTWKSG
jgi:hypothetical protein